MKLIRKGLNFQIRQVGPESDRVLEFVGSTADIDRYGDSINVDGWQLANFKANPVILWAHNYSVPAVGTARKVFVQDKALKFHVYFPTDEQINAAGWPSHTPTPETVYRLLLSGLLNAVSVGFQDLEREPILGAPDDQGYRSRTGWRFLKQELYELSIVPVPANPFALLQDAVKKGLVSAEAILPFELKDDDGHCRSCSGAGECEGKARCSCQDFQKGVIPYKEYPADDPAAAWDGPKEMGACGDDLAALKSICTWFDSAKPDAKGSYKLPHHRGGEGHKTVWKGVSAAMAALLRARGGVSIPDADRKGVYNHLAKHYAQFEKTPPEFKEYSEADLVRITLGHEPNGLGFDDLFLSGVLVSTELAPAKGVEPGIIRAGAVLNAKNKAALKQAQELIGQVLAAAEPAAEGTEGKEGAPAPEQSSIYSHAFKPGEEPHGGRQAGEAEEADVEELRSLTKNLHLTVCK